MATVLEQEEKQEESQAPEAPVSFQAAAMADTSSVYTDANELMDQLDYLLNHTVRPNDQFRREYTASFNTSTINERSDKMNAFVEMGDEVSDMLLATLRTKAKELKKILESQSKKWWTFADVVPGWNAKIEQVFRGNVTKTQNKHFADTISHDGHRCILGESWGGTGWGQGCEDCNWLGNQGLHAFITTDAECAPIIDKTKETAFRHYQERFEYHWNKYHNEVGNTYHKP